jgi:uncharacterized protein YoxC
MPQLLAVCAVVATAAQVAIAIAVIQAAARLDQVTLELERSARTFRDCAAQAQATGRDMQQLVAEMREVVPPVRSAAEAFGHVGERAADLSSAVLNEVEGPVRRTMNLFRGVQAGTSYFFNRLAHNGLAAKNGGTSDEQSGEQ